MRDLFRKLDGKASDKGVGLKMCFPDVKKIFDQDETTMETINPDTDGYTKERITYEVIKSKTAKLNRPIEKSIANPRDGNANIKISYEKTGSCD